MSAAELSAGGEVAVVELEMRWSIQTMPCLYENTKLWLTTLSARVSR